MTQLSLLNNSDLRMTSLEIAELTNKQHGHIMRDIREMLQQVGQSTFGESSYTNSQNRQMPMYELDRDLTMTLITGYDAGLRHRVVQRWRELEEGSATPHHAIPQTFAQALMLAAEQQARIEEQQAQLALQAPSVAFVGNYVERVTLQTATQVAQTLGFTSARALNTYLLNLGGVYNQSITRSKVFTAEWVRRGFGSMKQTESGHSQSLFTPAGIEHIARISTRQEGNV